MQEKKPNQLDDLDTIEIDLSGASGISSTEFSTIDLSGVAAQPSYAIDSMNYDTISYNGSSISTITLPSITGIGGNGAVGSAQYTFTNSNWNSIADPSVHITQGGIDMPADADIKIGNRSLKEFMAKMEERMAILVPDPKKIEKFQALKKAYENYKLMERLCQEDEQEKDQ